MATGSDIDHDEKIQKLVSLLNDTENSLADVRLMIDLMDQKDLWGRIIPTIGELRYTDFEGSVEMVGEFAHNFERKLNDIYDNR